jgi:hypothetical protein
MLAISSAWVFPVSGQAQNRPALPQFDADNFCEHAPSKIAASQQAIAKVRWKSLPNSASFNGNTHSRIVALEKNLINGGKVMRICWWTALSLTMSSPAMGQTPQDFAAKHQAMLEAWQVMPLSER